MADRCGDIARMAFEVTPELVDKVANVWAIRDEQTDLAARHVYVLKKAAWMNIDWPDLQEEGKPEGNFCGGRQVDYRGLEKKSYKERMAAQTFSLKIFVTSKSKQSDNTIKIEGYADKREGPISEGWVCNVELFKEVRRFNPFNNRPYTDVVVSPLQDYMKKGRGQIANIGKYHLDFKDGVLNIIIKLKLVAEGGGSLPAKVFKDIKSGVENFWNGSAGYRKWVFHRQGCQRKARCNCPVGMNEKKQFFAAGCCKVPVSVHVEEGGDNEVKVSLLGPNGSCTTRFYHPPLHPNSYAHEIGHMMGFPDQYKQGHTQAGAWASGFTGDFPIDDDSIMGSSKSMAKEAHFKKWMKWLGAIDNFTVLNCS